MEYVVPDQTIEEKEQFHGHLISKAKLAYLQIEIRVVKKPMPMINDAVGIVSIPPLPLRCDTSQPT
jgi:hypothetical protein